MKPILEHYSLSEADFKIFDPTKWNEFYPEGFLLNPNASEYDRKYFFTWSSHSSGNRPGYVASYVIGAQWIGEEPLVICPKLQDIDFLKMFSICLKSDLDSESFSKIYGIDLEKPLIKTNAFDSVLTPLIIVHFVMTVKKIVQKGLQSDFIRRNDNLKKIKGKVNILQNERKNIIQKRYDNIHCSFSERSTNIPVNKLLKKTLNFVMQIALQMKGNECFSQLYQQINMCLAAFENVDDQIEIREIRGYKSNKLYRDYDEAVRLAKLILKRYDYSISEIKNKADTTPVFWIDMALLYEHYVYGLLHEAYGNKVLYQESGWFKWKPDFLHLSEKIIMDTKYMPQLESQGISGEIVRQLSGYSRLNSFRNKLHVTTNKTISCLIIYSSDEDDNGEKIFKADEPILTNAKKVDYVYEIYKLPVPLPKCRPSTPKPSVCFSSLQI